MSLTILLLSGFAAAAEPTIEELLTAADDAARGDQSVGFMEMQVKTDRYERTMKMQVWAKGTEKTLVKILEPAKDAGVATLKVDENLWNYLPKVDRTMKVPAGMMSGAWMGSHLSNDDLVRENRLSDDFVCAFVAKPDTDPGGNYVISCKPKPEAAVVWGEVVATITPDKVPVKVDYLDEKAVLVRTMAYGDVQEVGGRKMPMTLTVTPHDKPGEFTKITFSGLDLTVQLDDALFSLQALKP